LAGTAGAAGQSRGGLGFLGQQTPHAAGNSGNPDSVHHGRSVSDVRKISHPALGPLSFMQLLNNYSGFGLSYVEVTNN
jgi:hypothetical protein